jgi:2-deoxy-D-gluconate 3-dehydrogenase
MEMFDLTDKVAIITGGNGGIGLGIAHGLAIAGAKVAIVGRNQDKIDKAVRDLQEAGADALGIRADVSLEDDVNRMVSETVAHFGRINILVNNAAISWGILAEETTLEEWNNFIAVNLTSCFLTSKACFPEMVKAGGGKIINIGSVITQMGFGRLAHYAAAKGGMDHMTQSLAQGWAKHNIHVNAVLPGLVHTEMVPCFGPNKTKAVDYVVSRTPIGRHGMPEDFQGITILLASGASDFITGAIMVVDGGWTLAI